MGIKNINEIANNFLLKGSKFLQGMLFRQPGFTYSAFKRLTKIKEIIQKFEIQTWDARYIRQNELDKASFKHGMAYVGLKDLHRRATSNKSSCNYC